MDAETRVDALIEVMGRLTELLDRESESVIGLRARELESMLVTKQHLADAYEQAARGLLDDPEARDALPAEIRERLTNAASFFSRALNANALALKAAKDANQRVVDMIVEAVNQQRRQSAGYAALGNRNAARRGTMAPMTLDARL